ncbi:hypothetical protein phiAS5_ORF0298 [Aeromonas phage phiAS5]|uniref:Uncharacterized protein n=1 Tax=Aeromonas phage phiAS5 TaxID=879630 RepID=E1A252_9CAUD|nr:hypothetical protein phiAS5_ORF0298 [Aeromonas phage phiAS5]ADM80141.1 hypothetical protein phiAS5_ORF0298 [Aeromonas phage phiAS5]BES53097.1 hypothetical protein [Aeromonas phage phiWae14]
MRLNFAVNSIDELEDFSIDELKKFEYVTVSFGEESTVYIRDRGYELHYKITKYSNSVAFSSEFETVVRVGDKLIKEV